MRRLSVILPHSFSLLRGDHGGESFARLLRRGKATLEGILAAHSLQEPAPRAICIVTHQSMIRALIADFRATVVWMGGVGDEWPENARRSSSSSQAGAFRSSVVASSKPFKTGGAASTVPIIHGSEGSGKGSTTTVTSATPTTTGTVVDTNSNSNPINAGRNTKASDHQPHHSHQGSKVPSVTTPGRTSPELELPYLQADEVTREKLASLNANWARIREVGQKGAAVEKRNGDRDDSMSSPHDVSNPVRANAVIRSSNEQNKTLIGKNPVDPAAESAGTWSLSVASSAEAAAPINASLNTAPPTRPTSPATSRRFADNLCELRKKIKGFRKPPVAECLKEYAKLAIPQNSVTILDYLPASFPLTPTSHELDGRDRPRKTDANGNAPKTNGAHSSSAAANVVDLKKANVVDDAGDGNGTIISPRKVSSPLPAFNFIRVLQVGGKADGQRAAWETAPWDVE